MKIFKGKVDTYRYNIAYAIIIISLSIIILLVYWLYKKATSQTVFVFMMSVAGVISHTLIIIMYNKSKYIIKGFFLYCSSLNSWSAKINIKNIKIIKSAYVFRSTLGWSSDVLRIIMIDEEYFDISPENPDEFINCLLNINDGIINISKGA